MITLNEMIKSVTTLFAQQNPNIVYVSGIRVFFEWNEELETWVVLTRAKFRERIDEVANVLIKEAIDTGNVDFIRQAIKFKEASTINKIQGIIREKTVEPVALLNKRPEDRKSKNYDGGPVNILDRKKPRRTKAEMDEARRLEEEAKKKEEASAQQGEEG